MQAIQDTATMTQRVLQHTMKSIDTLITVVVMPVMIMLMSVYIYGSAMKIGTGSYIDYVMPGILILTIISGAAYTSYRLTQDVTKGIFDRFHSMPIAKSAILGGHVYTSVLYNLVSLFFVIVIAMFFGFDVISMWQNTVLAFVLLIAFNFAITWVAVFFGLLAKNVETAGLFSYLLMALVFVSSAFAPTATMKPGLRAFAEHQPFSFIIDGLRDLLTTNTISETAWIGLGLSVAIWLVFRIASVVIYKKKLR